MRPELLGALEERLGTPIREAKRLAGGDINDAYALTLQDGNRIFLKTHPNPPRGLFEAEARGLRWIEEAGAIRVPRVLGYSDQRPAYLALELLEPATRCEGFDEVLGRALAALHSSGASSFGLDHDNFVGRLPQSNAPTSDWPTFYWRSRLEPQLRLASKSGLVDSGLRARFDALRRVLPELVGPDEPPSRLHGDLWGGNLHVDEAGRPALIDPAAYGGHREIDLAMMRLFGGFGSGVFAAYEETYPLAPGAAGRIPLYQLYPLLVHVNLFGRSYLGSLTGALAACV
jgi:fructosamine-3-kinase